MIEIIVIASFFIIIAALLFLIYLGDKNNPMSISATEDIMKLNNVTEMECNMKRREKRMDWVWPIGLAVALASIIIFFIV
jgi:hypothetical protein